MIGFPSSWRRKVARLLAGLAAPALLSAGAIRADEPPPPAVVAASPAPLADLASFRATAQERQPGVRAARASLAAALARAHSLDRLPVGGLLFARDLPVRRQQAAAGLQSYEAGVCVAEAETRYAITYFYIASLYARQQQAVLLTAGKELEDLYKVVEGLVKEEKYKQFLGAERLKLVESYVATLEGRRQDTLQGEERALAALREAMGVGPEYDVRPALKSMPVAAVNVGATKEEIVAMALARRGEVVQATTFAHVTCLEISAQGRTFLPSLRTFAAGSDIHALTVPSAVHGLEYRPGALAPEMPTMMAGPRRGRMEQATDYLARAEAVAEKTRNLITLESEDAFYRWQEARVKVQFLKKAAEDAEVLARFTRTGFRDAVSTNFEVKEPTRQPPATRIEDVLFSGATAVKMRIDANRAYFEYLLALATLERVTVGGFCVEFYPSADEGKANGK